MAAVVLAGPLIVRLPFVTLFLREFAERFATFVVAILLWELVVAYIRRFVVLAQPGKNRLRRLLPWIPAFALSAGLLMTMTHLEEKVSREFFLALIVLFGVRGVAQGLKIVGYDVLGFALTMFFFFGLSNLSAALTAASWQWQFAVCAFALQGGLQAEFFLQKFENLYRETTSEANLTRTFARAHELSLILGPVLVSFLVYAGFLPKNYLACLVAVVLAVRTQEIAKKLEKGEVGAHSGLQKIVIFSCASTLVFLICFTGAAFFDG